MSKGRTNRPSPLLAVAAVAGSLAYLGLAALGLGGVSEFLSHPALIATVVVFAVLTIASLFSGGNLSPGEREDRGNRWLLVAFAVVGLLSAFLPAYFDRLDVWTIDGELTRWIGVALLAAGGTLRLWPVFVLGNRFSGLVAIQPGHALVTEGIYGTIRNPREPGSWRGSIRQSQWRHRRFMAMARPPRE